MEQLKEKQQAKIAMSSRKVRCFVPGEKERNAKMDGMKDLKHASVKVAATIEISESCRKTYNTIMTFLSPLPLAAPLFVAPLCRLYCVN